MGLIVDIKSNIEDVEFALKWLKREINDQKGNSEIDFDMIESQFEDVESEIEDLISNTNDLIDAIEEL